MNQKILKANQIEAIQPQEYTDQIVVNPQKIRTLIKNLKSIFHNQIECEFGFRNYTTKETFDKIMEVQLKKQQLANYDYNFTKITTNQSSILLRQKQYKSREFQKSLKKYYFVLKNPGHVNVFFKVYWLKIIQLQAEYNCVIIPKKYSLCVCVKEQKLSQMLTQQILNMIHEQKIMFTFQKSLVYKLNFSKICREIIKKEGIQYEVFLPQSLLNLHSHQASFNQIIKIVQQKLSFHVTFLIFVTRTIDYYISFQLVRLISLQSLPIIQYIKQQFQIEVQTNPQQLCFILHDWSKVFSIESLQCLFQNMTNFRLFHLEGEGIRSMQNYMDKNKEYFSFAKWTYKYRKMFLLINSPQMQKQEDVYHLLKIFITDLNERSKIIIYLLPVGFLKQQKQAQKQRIIRLAEKYNLNIANFLSLSQNSYQNKIILHLKSFSSLNKIEKQNKVYNFFRQYLIKGPIHLSKSPSKIINNQKNTSIAVTNTILFQSQLINQEKSFSQLKERDYFGFTKAKQSVNLDCILFHFPEKKDLPIIQCFQKNPRNKDMRKIQRQLLDQIHMTFKLYKISIDRSISIRQPQLKEQYEILFVENAFKQGEIIQYSDVNQFQVNKIQAGSKGFIVFLSKKDKTIIPSYYFQRI